MTNASEEVPDSYSHIYLDLFRRRLQTLLRSETNGWAPALAWMTLGLPPGPIKLAEDESRFVSMLSATGEVVAALDKLEGFADRFEIVEAAKGAQTKLDFIESLVTMYVHHIYVLKGRLKTLGKVAEAFIDPTEVPEFTKKIGAILRDYNNSFDHFLRIRNVTTHNAIVIDDEFHAISLKLIGCRLLGENAAAESQSKQVEDEVAAYQRKWCAQIQEAAPALRAVVDRFCFAIRDYYEP